MGCYIDSPAIIFHCIPHTHLACVAARLHREPSVKATTGRTLFPNIENLILFIHVIILRLTVHTPIKIGSAVCPKCQMGISFAPGARGKCSLSEASRSPGLSKLTAGTPNVCPKSEATAPPREWPVSHMVAPGYLSATSMYMCYKDST